MRKYITAEDVRRYVHGEERCENGEKIEWRPRVNSKLVFNDKKKKPTLDYAIAPLGAVYCRWLHPVDVKNILSSPNKRERKHCRFYVGSLLKSQRTSWKKQAVSVSFQGKYYNLSCSYRQKLRATTNKKSLRDNGRTAAAAALLTWTVWKITNKHSVIVNDWKVKKQIGNIYFLPKFHLHYLHLSEILNLKLVPIVYAHSQ